MTFQNAPLDPDTLVVRNVYRLRSRNLAYGVYDGDRGFIGIREKFGYFYLDTEYLGATACALEFVGRIEEPVAIVERLGSRCQTCKGDINFVEWGTREELGRGRWVCVDTTCTKAEPQAVSNTALFGALQMFDPQI